jgi:hypothetical protein
MTSADKRLQATYYVDGVFIFTLEKYYKLLEFQDGGCAICGRKPTKIRLSVDHRHTDGLLRGLLCFRCNRAYGLFHDNDARRLRRAADYLENSPFISLYGIQRTAPGELGTKKRAKLLKKMKGSNGH